MIFRAFLIVAGLFVCMVPFIHPLFKDEGFSVFIKYPLSVMVIAVGILLIIVALDTIDSEREHENLTAIDELIEDPAWNEAIAGAPDEISVKNRIYLKQHFEIQKKQKDDK